MYDETSEQVETIPPNNLYVIIEDESLSCEQGEHQSEQLVNEESTVRICC